MFFATPANSRQAVTASLGTEHTMNIFPSDVSSNGWKNSGNVSSQDLPDYALYQEFNQLNSAVFDEFYVDESPAQPDVQESVELIPNEVESSDEIVPSEAEQETEPVETPSETEATTEETVSYVDTQSQKFKVDLRQFPLAQLTLTTTTEATAESVSEEVAQDDILEENSPLDENQPEETQEEDFEEQNHCLLHTK